jgi:transcriptional regulator NrdR family protein
MQHMVHSTKIVCTEELDAKTVKKRRECKHPITCDSDFTALRSAKGQAKEDNRVEEFNKLYRDDPDAWRKEVLQHRMPDRYVHQTSASKPMIEEE